MKNVPQKLLVLCCALYLSGAHWVVLQATAWTGMLVSRSYGASVASAIESTFDGQHPCAMCSAIADGKKTERQAQLGFDLLKKVGDLKFLEMEPTEVGFQSSVGFLNWPVSWFDTPSRFEAPPTPPPLA